jgi:hypothetical protein
MKTPHKHAELIKAWAEGAEIEFYSKGLNGWIKSDTPQWYDEYEYRIKPEPKPDHVVSRWVYSDGSTAFYSQSNVKYTFDGETGKLKLAEVL